MAGNLFADNGSGADTDPDGPPLAISAVNGSGANVGAQITLASGALLTVNANGTFDYDPNGAFLPTPTAGSGASNTPGHDSFSYTLAGGNTVTVSITLTGLDTDDLLLGTAGADILIGGNGNDTYIVEQSADRVIEAAGGGTRDVVYTSVDYNLVAMSEVEVLSASNQAGTTPLILVGNELNQEIYGNAGANYLQGGGGTDYLIGLGGNDTYFVTGPGDIVVEGAGEGTRDVVYAAANYTLGVGVQVEVLSAASQAATTALSLIGNAFNQEIYGNEGANYLEGGGGADTLIGLGGDDIYIVDADEYVSEGAGGGRDVVYAMVSYALAAGEHVEVLSTISQAATTAIDLGGNEFDNELYGNAGTNILNGAAGADVMAGFGGNDTYYVDQAGDVVYEDVGGGNDSVYASGSFALTAGQEIELLLAADFSSTESIDLTGNEFANTIYGNAGANVLDGKGGNDSLVGQQGADTYAFTTALGAGNVDVVFGFEHNLDRIALDDAVFAGIGPLGGLNANAFVVGSAALDGDDRIIYNNLTGQLFFDADGSGAGAAIQFATLSPGLTLTATDFIVI